VLCSHLNHENRTSIDFEMREIQMRNKRREYKSSVPQTAETLSRATPIIESLYHSARQECDTSHTTRHNQDCYPTPVACRTTRHGQLRPHPNWLFWMWSAKLTTVGGAGTKKDLSRRRAPQNSSYRQCGVGIRHHSANPIQLQEQHLE